MTSYRELDDISLLSDTVLAARQRRRVGGSIAVLISGALDRPRLVPIALETGFSPETTLENVDFEPWVPLGSIRGNVVDLSAHRVALPGALPPFAYTMYFTPKIIEKHRTDLPERDWRIAYNDILYDSSTGTVDWYANVLIVKHTREEPYHLHDCTPEDLDPILQHVINLLQSPDAPVQRIRVADRRGEMFSDDE